MPIILPIVDALDLHRQQCVECRPWHVCPVAARLLESLAELAAPIPPIPRPKAKA